MTAPTYDNVVKAARMNATRTAVVSGTLEVQAANNDVLAIWTLTDPGGTVSNAVWTLAFANNSVTGQAAAGSGTTATKARLKNSTGDVRITGLSVGTSGSAVNLDNTSIASGQTVTISSATFTHAVDPT
jgi:hypothetical protein